MEESLITFKTNKLAKEKGFNIEQVIIHSYNEGLEESLIKGVSQSLLQKWLREVHGIYVSSDHDYDPKDKSFQFYTSWGFYNPDTIKKKQSGWYDEYNDWKKYEDALEFGLQEGLKLISEIT